MAISEALQQTVEELRTDPVGFTCLALSVAIPFVMERVDNMPPIASTIANSTSLALFAGGLKHVKNMFEYARQIEQSISEVGFDNTRFRVHAYCPRQVSRVICQKAGFLDDYINICDAKDGLRYRFLPHI